MEKTKNCIFKFSVNPERDFKLVAFLKAIPSKNARGEWIRKALKAYMEIERAGYCDANVFDYLLDCIREKSKPI